MKNFICLFIFMLLSAKNPLIAKEIPKEDQNLEEAVKFAIKSEFLFHNSGVRSELWMWAKDFTREIRCVKLNKRHWLIGVERSSKDYYPVVDVRDLGRFQAFVLQKYGKRGVIKRLPCNIYIFLEDLIDNIAKESYKTYRLRLKEECNITKEKNFAINQKNNKNVKYFKFKLGNAKRKTPHNAEWEKTLKAIEKKIERWLNPYNEISQRIEPLHPRHENAIIAMQDVSIYDAFFVGVILFSEKTEKHSGIEHLVLYIVNRKENLEISEICLDTMEEKPESPEAVQSSIYEYLRTPCLFWKIKKQKDGKYKIEPMFDTLY